MQHESTTSVDGSVHVHLGLIDSDEDSDLAFPRLDVFAPEDLSRFFIKIRDTSGMTSMLEVSASDTVANVKRRIAPNANSIELIELQFSGETLVTERTLSSCGIVCGSELSVLEYPNDGSSVHSISHDPAASIASSCSTSAAIEVPRGVGTILSEAELRGLVNKARVRVLHGWNGVMSDGQSIGLPLRVHDLVMIGKIVNQDWYEGYRTDNPNWCGYLPRNYVEIESLYNEDFRQKLGSDGQNHPVQSTTPLLTEPDDRPVLSTMTRPAPAFLDLAKRVHRAITIFRRITGKSSQNSKQRQLFHPDEPNDPHQRPPPPLPPSPFPPKPPIQTLDLFQQGSRVRLAFHLEHDTPAVKQPVVRLVLSLVSAPEARIAFATIELQFEHDTITDLEPKREEGASTEVQYEESVGTAQSLTGSAGYGPAALSLTAERTDNKLAKYARRTRGTVVGDGIGSSRAYWVIKEDSGQAARFGVDPEQNMAVMLHVRPVRVDYQINAKVVVGDGKTGGWLNTKRMTSGRQRFYFRI